MEVGRIDRNPDADAQGEGAPRQELTAEESERQAAERLEEIHQFLSDSYARRDVVAQTRTPKGVMLDWVPIESQLGGEALAEPPEEDRPSEPSQGDRPVEPLRFELQQEGAELGPEGTVPVVRKPIDRIRPTVGLQDWLAKGMRAKRLAPTDSPQEIEAPATAEHKHAICRQQVSCYGTEGNINAWSPYVEWTNEFSLGQLWLVGGSGAGTQTLEVGHQAYYDIYGDWAPHLFIYFTTCNYTKHEDYVGGYNQIFKGWVQTSRTVHPEALSTPLSEFGGVQYDMALKVQLWLGNWWVRVNGIWMGYYPSSLYNAAGSNLRAARVEWGGEIADSDHRGTTETDMGNGHWPYEGFQQCAFMSNLQYQSGDLGEMRDLNGVGIAGYSNCYDIQTHMNSGGSWGSYLWWGGSGKNSGCP